MPPPTGRTVEVKMKFVADAKQAQGEMAATRRETERLGVEARKTQAEMSKVGKGGGAGGAGGGSEGGEMKSAMAMAKFMAVVAVFTRALEAASKAVAIFYNHAIRKEDRPLLAGYEVSNALTFGLTERIARPVAGMTFAKSSANEAQALLMEQRQGNRLGIFGGMRQQIGGLNESYDSAMSAIEAQRSLGQQTLLDQMGMRDKRDHRYGQADQSIREALAGVGAAESSKSYADTEVNRLKKLVRGEQANVFKAEEMSGLGGGNKFNQEEKKTRQRMAYMALLQREKELEAAIQNQHKTGLDLEQRRSQLKQASLNTSRAELDILKEKEATAKGHATEFGMMSGADKLAVKYGLQQAQSQGWDTLPEETRMLLARTGLSQEYSKKQANQSVQDDPVYQAAVAMAGGQTESQLNKEIIKVESKIKLEVENNANELAEALRMQWADYFNKMEPLIIDIAKNQFKIVLNERKQVMPN